MVGVKDIIIKHPNKNSTFVICCFSPYLSVIPEGVSPFAYNPKKEKVKICFWSEVSFTILRKL